MKDILALLALLGLGSSIILRESPMSLDEYTMNTMVVNDMAVADLEKQEQQDEIDLEKKKYDKQHPKKPTEMSEAQLQELQQVKEELNKE